MKDMIKCESYYGSVHFDEDDALFFGKVEFVKAVEGYLELCEEQNSEPEKPFKGSFNVRVLPELHRRTMLTAQRKGVSLNKFVADTLEKATK